MNKHLTTAQMLEFIMIEYPSDENIALINQVNNHILHCQTCLSKLQALMTIKDSINSKHLMMLSNQELQDAILKEYDFND